ncbi:uncharacterized protein LOC141909647 [Tubulanus polymorphus]|uniref:uncharacterized protein LOC141909647 n=1 Tax=Tubulanus polymorphus TaxID=672921 RepID=UPI003DA6B46D
MAVSDWSFTLDELRNTRMNDNEFNKETDVISNLETTMSSSSRQLVQILNEHVMWLINDNGNDHERAPPVTDDDDESSVSSGGISFDHEIGLVYAEERPPELSSSEPSSSASSVVCKICFDVQQCVYRSCCLAPYCEDCLMRYVNGQVDDKLVPVVCPSTHCQSIISDKYVYRYLKSPATRDKYKRFIIDLNRDPNKKTCPHCNHITEVDIDTVRKKVPGTRRTGFVVECTACQLRWCFQCQSPSHAGLSCRQYQRGDRLLKSWAKHRRGYDQAPNAQKCPKCKFYIERSEGCDHMTCSKCHTDFCYRCGERYRSVQLLGNHHSRWSILGCKYVHRPNQPIRRKLERGSIFVSALFAAPPAIVFGAAAATVLLGTGVLLGPAYGFYRLHKYRKKKRRERELAEWDRQCRQELVRYRWLEESIIRRRYLEQIAAASTDHHQVAATTASTDHHQVAATATTDHHQVAAAAASDHHQVAAAASNHYQVAAAAASDHYQVAAAASTDHHQVAAGSVVYDNDDDDDEFISDEDDVCYDILPFDDDDDENDLASRTADHSCHGDDVVCNCSDDLVGDSLDFLREFYEGLSDAPWCQDCDTNCNYNNDDDGPCCHGNNELVSDGDYDTYL